MTNLEVFPAGPELENRCRQFALRAVEQSKIWFDNKLNLLPDVPISQLFDTRFDYHYNRCIGSAGQCMAGDEAFRLKNLAIYMPPVSPPHGPVAPPAPAPPSPDAIRIELWRVTVNGRRERLRVEIREMDGRVLFSAKGRRTQFSGEIKPDAIVISQGFGFGPCHGELRPDPATGKWQGEVKGTEGPVRLALVRG